MPVLSTATFLFTDIEGSTRLWEQRQEGMRRSLARHDELLRAAIETEGGEVVKTTGDGMLAVFESSDAALESAAAAQRALADEPWGESGPLRVRMAVHTGGAEARDGDYFGTAVNRAARLMAIAHGGQVLVSQATEMLARDGLSPNVDLHDLGEHHLRDLARPERVFQLVAPGLVTEFPPLESIGAPPSRLPVQLTSFIGRELELSAIADLVREHRVITIIGVGGVGKTRLALESAAKLAPEFHDGVWCCELAPATDADSMVDTVGCALGVIDRPGRTRRESVLDFLSTRHLLVVWDNCEHLLDPVAELATDVLNRCSGVTILATSREPLSMAGERVWGLRSLPTPTGIETHELAATDAVHLFADRAQASRPNFALDETNVGPIAEICRRLDGIPLAIELAAARVLAMQPAEIASRLDERFRLLSAGRRAAVERHQTLRATVDWSYSMLSDIERLVFGRLGVFPASFDADAAAAVASGDRVEEWDVLDALNSLVAKSMLTTEDSGDATTRFGMLETLRQYARDRLDEAGSVEIDARQRLLTRHFADVAEDLGPRLATNDEVPASRQVVLEIENIRSALSWALDRDEPDDQSLAARIVAALSLVVSLHRSLAFGSWAERTATVARDASPGLRFAALGAAAFSAVQRGDAETALRLLDDALAGGPPDNAPSYAGVYSAMALATASTDLGQAIQILLEGADVAERAGDGFAAAVCHSQAGIFAALSGDPMTGHAETDRGLELARRLENPTAMAVASYVWAAARWLDDPTGALEALEQSAALTEAGASDVVYPDTHELLARLRCQAGDLTVSLTEIRRALHASAAWGGRPNVASHLWYIAEILGTFAIEPEVVAVVEGICASSSLAPSMIAFAGRELEIHNRALAKAQALIGAEAFDRLRKRGSAMSYEDAVEYTQGELNRILDRVDA